MEEWFNWNILQQNPSSQEIYRDTIESTRNIFTTNIISIDDLSNIDIINDYKLLCFPDSRKNNDIYIREAYQWFQIAINFKTPQINQLGVVRMWHLQINIFKEWKKIWRLYGELHPNSGTFKFAWLQKTKQDEKKVGEQLMNIFFKIIPQFQTQGKTIDYSTTTEQRKIEVCYLLKKYGFKPKSEKYRNEFNIYINPEGQFFIYTTSITKIKGTNKYQFIFLKEQPHLSSDTLQFVDKVYIGTWIHYILDK